MDPQEIALPASAPTSRFDRAFPVVPAEDAATDLADAVRVNGADLRTDLVELPQLITSHGVVFARAHSGHLAAKQAVTEAEHQSYLLQRELAEVEGEKVTEALLAARVSRSPVVREARARLVEAEFEREAAKAVCDGLRAKRVVLEALVDLGRAEGSALSTGMRQFEDDARG